MKYFLLVASFLLSAHFIDADPVRKNLTTSIIIPCCAQHARHLCGLLKELEKQTVLPDEVLISLSEAGSVDPQIIEELKHTQWKFPILLTLFPQKLFAGENRNAACIQARGDIFICQDADDIPHPQRVEIIKYFFEKHDIVHFMHQWFGLDEGEEPSFDLYENLEDVPFFYPQNYMKEIYDPVHFTNGNVALTRQLFDNIRWSSMPRGQDSIFNFKVYANFHGKCLAVKTPLLAVRGFLSSALGATIES